MSSCSALTSIETVASIPIRGLPFRERIQVAFAQQASRLWWLTGMFIQAVATGFVSLISNVWIVMSCKAVIGIVAAFDTYLTIKYAVSLDIYEQNPLGRWLMGLDHGPVSDTQQIAAFITAKFVGTLMVLLAIQGLAYWRVRVAGLVALPLALCQATLVLHLVCAEG